MATDVVVPVAAAGALFAVALWALIAKPNLIRIVIGLELLGKASSLILITAGYAGGDVGMSQAVVFTLIAIEAVVAAVALALVVRIQRTFGSMNVSAIARQKWGEA